VFRMPATPDAHGGIGRHFRHDGSH